MIDDEARTTSRSKREGLAPLIVSVDTLYVFRGQLQGFSGSGARGHWFTGCFRLFPFVQPWGLFPVRHALG